MSDTKAETDLAKLIDDVQSLKRDLAALADHSRGTLWSGASDAANAVGSEAQRLYDGVAAQGKRSAKAISDQVEDQPLLSILIAFGVGFLGGRILPR
ncbi:MAG TPA: hypothetical protein VH020_13005 [Stellaceae bacterium]|jgi:ElaB/YqjD/DUF883 family membrane-anchored ribosome-binding protein|nr:hypothetical protein [Stellaceae bacterium]